MIAFIGVGKIALEHLKVIKALGLNVSYATCKSNKSKNWKTFRKISKETRFIKNIKDILNNKKIQFIVCSLPWNITHKYINYFADSQKKILIEKPFALEVSQIQSKKIFTQKNLLIGFNRRFYKTVNRLKKRVDEGGLLSATINISEDVDNLINRHGTKVIKYVLEYSSCHILDLALYLFGKIKIVKIYKKQIRTRKVNFDNFYILLETEEKIPISLTIIANDPIKIGFFLKFDDFTSWELSPIEKLKIYKGYKKIEPRNMSNIRTYEPKLIGEIKENAKYKPGFMSQIESFFRNKDEDFSKPLDNFYLLNLINKIKNS